MKKIICVLIAFTLMLAISMPAFAATDLSAVFDSNDFIKQYEQKILDDVNETISPEFNYPLPRGTKILTQIRLQKKILIMTE